MGTHIVGLQLYRPAERAERSLVVAHCLVGHAQVEERGLVFGVEFDGYRFERPLGLGEFPHAVICLAQLVSIEVVVWIELDRLLEFPLGQVRLLEIVVYLAERIVRPRVLRVVPDRLLGGTLRLLDRFEPVGAGRRTLVTVVITLGDLGECLRCEFSLACGQVGDSFVEP